MLVRGTIPVVTLSVSSATQPGLLAATIATFGPPRDTRSRLDKPNRGVVPLQIASASRQIVGNRAGRRQLVPRAMSTGLSYRS